MTNKDFYAGKLYYSKSEKHFKNFCDAFLCMCIIICFCVVVFNSLFFPAIVSGSSMVPTLNADYANNSTHRDMVYATNYLKANKGDIVLVDLPGFENDGIKRLIATGGDVVSFGDIYKADEDSIYINDEKLVEVGYLKNDNTQCVNGFKQMIKECVESGEDYYSGDRLILKYEWIKQNSAGEYQIHLPQDYCIFLGDNRPNSYDCSEIGPQKNTSIHAKVVMIIPYGYNLLTYFSSKLFGAL